MKDLQQYHQKPGKKLCQFVDYEDTKMQVKANSGKKGKEESAEPNRFKKTLVLLKLRYTVNSPKRIVSPKNDLE